MILVVGFFFILVDKAVSQIHFRACGEGFKLYSKNSSVCIPYDEQIGRSNSCEAGQYENNDGVCAQCPEGKYARAGKSECTDQPRQWEIITSGTCVNIISTEDECKAAARSMPNFKYYPGGSSLLRKGCYLDGQTTNLRFTWSINDYECTSTYPCICALSAEEWCVAGKYYNSGGCANCASLHYSGNDQIGGGKTQCNRDCNEGYKFVRVHSGYGFCKRLDQQIGTSNLCEAGQYENNDGACAQCPEGKYARAGKSECTDQPRQWEHINNGTCVNPILTEDECKAAANGPSIGIISHQYQVSGCFLNGFNNRVYFNKIDTYIDCSEILGDSRSRCICASSTEEWCAPGKYYNSGTCEDCPSGKYQPHEGKTTCIDCPVSGGFSDAGSTSKSDCMLCSPGKYLNSITCEECPSGQYQEDYGKTSCKSCNFGEKSGFQKIRCILEDNQYMNYTFINSGNCGNNTINNTDDCKAAHDYLFQANSAELITYQIKMYYKNQQPVNVVPNPENFPSHCNIYHFVPKTNDYNFYDEPPALLNMLAVKTSKSVMLYNYDESTNECDHNDRGQCICSNNFEVCPKHTYQDSTTYKCLNCPTGYFQNEIAKSRCDYCVAGTYLTYDEQNNGECVTCPLGKFSQSFSVDLNSCEPIIQLKYAPGHDLKIQYNEISKC